MSQCIEYQFPSDTNESQARKEFAKIGLTLEFPDDKHSHPWLDYDAVFNLGFDKVDEVAKRHGGFFTMRQL